ncbi:MAG: MipA/OmpV family protein [Bdellovibrionota bacterium]
MSLSAGQIFLLFIFFLAASAQAMEENKPLWEYGAGIGYVRYAHYPASDQYSQLALPFPTFQYRGEILRADDRDGGRAYLLKNDKWALEFSGGGSLPVDSSNNTARRDMNPLPLVLDAGPQLVYSENRTWEFKISAFPSVSIDGTYWKQNGGVAKAQIGYRWEKEMNDWGSPVYLSGTFHLGGKTASQEYHETYYEVSERFATTTRPAYHARAGYLETEYSYFQRFTSGRFTLYLSLDFSDYSGSANRLSPLYRATTSLAYAVGLTYVLGESEKRSVPEENTKGVINKVIKRASDRNQEP